MSDTTCGICYEPTTEDDLAPAACCEDVYACTSCQKNDNSCEQCDYLNDRSQTYSTW